MNTFYLLLNVANENVVNTEQDILILFSILCMQKNFNEVYDCIIKERDVIDEKYIKDFLNPNSNIYNNLEYDDEKMKLTVGFMKEIYKIFDFNGNGEIEKDELENFKRVLGFSDVTSR